MATNYTNTLAGLLMLNDQNMADIYPNGVLDDAPVIARLVAVPASSGGTQHKYLRRSYRAGAGFRELNTGVSNAAERFDDITVTCKILDPSFDRDVMLADAYRKGRSEYIKKETAASLKSAFFSLEKAIFNFDQPTQFVGLPYMLEYADTNYNSPSQIVSAGGAGGKSVYLLRTGEDAFAVVAGNDGKVSMLWDDDSPTIVRVTDTGSNPYSAYRVTMGGYFGLQVGAIQDVVRIANLDTTSDNLLTDDLLSEAISKFPAARKPNLIVMNRTALAELQQSRTAVNPTGAPAPFPSEAFGVPIVGTDALSDAEATVDSSTTTSTTSSSI